MPQRPKDHVRRARIDAAADAFAAAGLQRATLSDIAQRAGTSVGNLYKYFPTKEELFAATVPAEFSQEFEQLIQRQIGALGSELDALSLGAEHPYRQASEQLLRFSLVHRSRIVFLLLRADGTPHAGFTERLVRTLTKLATRYAEAAYPNFAMTAAQRRALTRVYRGFVAALAAILEEETSEPALRHAVRLLTSYHLSGLQAFFQFSTQQQRTKGS